MYSTSYEPALIEIAKLLKMPRDWLFNVINLESNWNPTAYNKSGAVGLIQFMPDTLKSMGLLSPALASRVSYEKAESEDLKQKVKAEFLAKYPDAVAQLQGPVLQYFKGRSYPTEQSVYMRVFYPAYANAPLSQTFPANVQAQNPGVKTVGDYVSLVQNKAALANGIRKGLPLAGLALAGLAVYFLSAT